MKLTILATVALALVAAVHAAVAEEPPAAAVAAGKHVGAFAAVVSNYLDAQAQADPQGGEFDEAEAGEDEESRRRCMGSSRSHQRYQRRNRSECRRIWRRACRNERRFRRRHRRWCDRNTGSSSRRRRRRRRRSSTTWTSKSAKDPRDIKAAAEVYTWEDVLGSDMLADDKVLTDEIKNVYCVAGDGMGDFRDFCGHVGAVTDEARGDVVSTEAAEMYDMVIEGIEDGLYDAEDESDELEMEWDKYDE